MVKGRRVRAVVACTRNDSCCTKRRAQKLQKTASPTDAFEAFFETAKIDEEKLDDGHERIILKLCTRQQLVTDVEDVERDVPMTTQKVETTTTPSTPHRIELNQDGDVKMAPKAKKRLEMSNHKLTEYFPVRRSERKTKKTVLEEKRRSLEQSVRDGQEEGLQVRFFADKGRGVLTSRPFTKGEFVVEYSGDLIDLNEAKQREFQYAQDLNAGCYMYYFKHNNQQYCVDATAETGKLGRLVNHSRNGNLITKTVTVDNMPRLVLIAKDDIKEGDEVTYDYGDRSKESLRHHPWLAC